ncbi:DUF4241 domain-containing protein [Streptomyces europaeiscabiei]|uniref:DUF4241 domain-containing protein n=1 Tax=Streptomyces europaeiscabiei TaxID=146819 RepID=UPI0029B179B2|nr:DUF4241 domain-containing protein [Streptomyces europaeiscabiei]MDX3698021.1 DUF4241 domain-containing protein [Streptomyces europaeiscabiei]
MSKSSIGTRRANSRIGTCIVSQVWDVCFVDASAVSVLADHEDWLIKALAAYAAADFGLPPVRAVGSAGEEVAAFTTGRGYGFYPTWVGRTESGDVASFVTDFLVLEKPTTSGGPS